MFALLFMQVSLFINTTLLNSNFYKNKLKPTAYYIELNKELSFAYKNLSMVTSVPEEVYKSSLSEEYTNKLAVNNIDNTMLYMKRKLEVFENKVDTAPFNENLTKYVNTYAENNKIKVDDALKKQITAMTEEAGKIVGQHTALFNISAVADFKEFQAFRKGIFYLYNKLFFSFIFVAFLIAALFLLNSKRIRRGFLWVGSSFIAASLMSIIPMLLAIIIRVPYKLPISSAYLKIALQQFTLGYIYQLLSIGIVFLVIGIASIATYLNFSKSAQ
jgi:hypothetical protein